MADQPPAGQEVPVSSDSTDPGSETHPGAFADIRAYFTAPLHWSGTEWGVFAGVLATVDIAHHFDDQVRSHFVSRLGASDTADTKDLQDALPTAGIFVGTLDYANLIDSQAGRLETWTMFEAAALSGVTAYAPTKLTRNMPATV